MASLLKTRIIEVLKGLEVYALTKTLQSIESDSSSHEKDTLVDVLMSDIMDIGLQIVLSRLQPGTLKLIIKNAHLDPENQEQSQAELEEHITAMGIREYLLELEQRAVSMIIKDLGIETSPREIVATELGKSYRASSHLSMLTSRCRGRSNSFGPRIYVAETPRACIAKYYCKSLQIKSTSRKYLSASTALEIDYLHAHVQKKSNCSSKRSLRRLLLAICPRSFQTTRLILLEALKRRLEDEAVYPISDTASLCVVEAMNTLLQRNQFKSRLWILWTTLSLVH